MIEELVKQIEARFAELGEQMTDGEVISAREEKPSFSIARAR